MLIILFLLQVCPYLNIYEFTAKPTQYLHFSAFIIDHKECRIRKYPAWVTSKLKGTGIEKTLIKNNIAD